MTKPAMRIVSDTGLKLANQRDGITPSDEAAEFHLRVRDARRKAELVDLPQAIEVGGAVVADGERDVGGVRA